MLARIEPDERIASILNLESTPYSTRTNLDGEAHLLTAPHHAIPVYCDGERQSRDEMSVREVAATLGVTSTTVFRMIRVK